MSRSHANRGKGWEAVLDGIHRRYEAEGRASVVNTFPKATPRRSRAGRVEGMFYARQTDGLGRPKAPPDYHVQHGPLSIWLDAKETTKQLVGGPVFPWANLKAGQAQFMSSHEAQAPTAVSALLIRFVASRSRVVVPWPAVEERWRAWHLRWARGDRAKRGQGGLLLADALEVGASFGNDWLTPLCELLEDM